MSTHSYYWDSGDADSTGAIQLRSGVLVETVGVVEATIPVLWPALRQCRLHFFERMVGQVLPVPDVPTDGSAPTPSDTLTYPDASPTLTELLAWLKAELDAHSQFAPGYTVTVDSKTNRVTIAANDPTIQFALYAGPKGRNLLKAFGWTDAWTDIGTSLTSPYAARPAGSNYVLVHSNLGRLVRTGVLDRDSSKTFSDVIATIPLTADFTAICTYQPSEPDMLELSPGYVVSDIKLTLHDPENLDRLDTLLGPHRWTARLKIGLKDC